MMPDRNEVTVENLTLELEFLEAKMLQDVVEKAWDASPEGSLEEDLLEQIRVALREYLSG